jgi:SAM-dependent methyltransferase
MDRQTWLDMRQAAVVTAYDADAPTYGDDAYPNDSQREFVARLLEACPPSGLVLDAPCGTGRYFAQVADAGRRVVGIDPSAGMLEAARARGVAVDLHQVRLQELAFTDTFDGAMTIDAMEHVPPEDWPRVLGNLARALRRGGHLYLTVEEQDQAATAAAFEALAARGLPAVYGEVIEGDVAGYHFYPARAQVRAWLEAAHLRIVEEATEPQADWAYWHLLLRVD